MRLVKVTATITYDNPRIVIDRGIPYNSRKVKNSNELSLKSDGRNGYKISLYAPLFEKVCFERDPVIDCVRCSVWCKEMDADKWAGVLSNRVELELLQRIQITAFMLEGMKK